MPYENIVIKTILLQNKSQNFKLTDMKKNIICTYITQQIQSILSSFNHFQLYYNHWRN